MMPVLGVFALGVDMVIEVLGFEDFWLLKSLREFEKLKRLVS